MTGTLQEDYLIEARKAEERAQETLDPYAAELWRQVAKTLRELAAGADGPLNHSWH